MPGGVADRITTLLFLSLWVQRYVNNLKYSRVFAQMWIEKERFGQKSICFCPNVGGQAWIWAKSGYRRLIQILCGGWPW